MFTRVYAPKIITQAPVASPSSPSVRFTPLLAAAIRNKIQMRATISGSCSMSMSRRNEIALDAG